MDVPYEYIFPAIRGVQAGREYFVSMCPLRLLSRLFLFDDAELVPELRAQRRLNKSRLPEMARYMVSNPAGYVFSAITVSVDGDVRFFPYGDKQGNELVGLLHVSMSARFVINDGQHRRAAIEMALQKKPEMGDESIAVVMFMDRGLERCQQMFADLNRYAVKPTTSLGVLYDHRDENALLVKEVVLKSGFFRDLVEVEKSSLAKRSRHLLTLSALYAATAALLQKKGDAPFAERYDLARAFWEAVAKAIPEWGLVHQGQMSAQEVRQGFLHSHAIALQAFGRVGSVLVSNGKPWRRKIQKLGGINWSRTNSALWEGRAMVGGRVSKAATNVTLTTNVLKKHVGLPLTDEEESVERGYLRGSNDEQDIRV